MEVEEQPAFETICMARSLAIQSQLILLSTLTLISFWHVHDLYLSIVFHSLRYHSNCFFFQNCVEPSTAGLLPFMSLFWLALHFIFYSVSFFYSIPRIVPARELSIFHLMVFQCQSLLKDVHPKNPFRFLSFTGLYYQGVRASFTTV